MSSKLDSILVAQCRCLLRIACVRLGLVYTRLHSRECLLPYFVCEHWKIERICICKGVLRVRSILVNQVFTPIGSSGLKVELRDLDNPAKSL